VQHIIMPPHMTIIGMPPFIMVIMRLQHSMNMAWSMPSIDFISHIMPVSVIVQVIVPIIIGIGIIMGMPPIIGIMPFMGIMPFIIIGDIIGWPMPPIMGFIIGIMFIAVFMKVSRPAARVSRFNERVGIKCAKRAQEDKSFQESFLQ
jgi:Na+/citrate or Na+/malate symporter